MGREEVQLASGERFLQIAQEQSPEHPRQHPDRQEEPRPAGDPAFTVGRDPAAGNEKMQMRVVGERLPPVCSTARKPISATEMLVVRGDGAQRLRRRTKQDVVHHSLVLKRDDLDLRRDGEHDVEVRYVEQFRLAVLQPLGAGETLALRAVAIPTRVVRDALMAAITAPLDVTAERGGAATLDRDHGMPLRRGQRPAVPVTESRAEVAEHVRHFQPLAGHETRASGGYQVRHRWQDDVQRLQRTGGGADRAGGDHEILSRGAQIPVTEQQLDGAEIGTGFQQMNGEGVAQRVRRNRFIDAAQQSHLPAGPVDGERRDGLAGLAAGNSHSPGWVRFQ